MCVKSQEELLSLSMKLNSVFLLQWGSMAYIHITGHQFSVNNFHSPKTVSKLEGSTHSDKELTFNVVLGSVVFRGHVGDGIFAGHQLE
jgi:hypothetical protein